MGQLDNIVDGVLLLEQVLHYLEPQFLLLLVLRLAGVVLREIQEIVLYAQIDSLFEVAHQSDHNDLRLGDSFPFEQSQCKVQVELELLGFLFRSFIDCF